jgi:hypothetical protein
VDREIYKFSKHRSAYDYAINLNEFYIINKKRTNKFFNPKTQFD